MKPSKSYTVEQALSRMEHYCAYQERCHKEVEQKLFEMSLIPQAKEKIILHLLEHNFLNETRFAKAFARGKFSIKHWGKQRIIKELKMRQISAHNIREALNEIDPVVYAESFKALALKKNLGLSETNVYKRRKKLADYLLYRGWESDWVYEKVRELIP